MTTRNTKGQTYPSAIRQLEGRVYRWRKRYASDCRAANRSDQVAQRDILRVRETRRRLGIAEAALERARQ